MANFYYFSSIPSYNLCNLHDLLLGVRIQVSVASRRARMKVESECNLIVSDIPTIQSTVMFFPFTETLMIYVEIYGFRARDRMVVGVALC